MVDSFLRTKIQSKTVRLLANAIVLASLSSAFVFAAENTKGGSVVPDFYENGVGWITRSNDFLPPHSGLGPVMSDPSHPYIMESAGGQVQTFRVADVTHPALMPWVTETLRKQNEQVLSGKPLYTVANSCRPAGVPNMLLVRLTPFFFVQTPNEVWLIWQNDHMVRRVFLNRDHSPNLKPTWFGESVGHYENGDTLVVDTIGLNTQTTVDNYHTPHTDKLHVIERFHRLSGGRIMEVEVTVEDTGAFTQPWHALQRYGGVDFQSRRTPELGALAGDAEPFLSEEVCAETAVTPVNIGMPPVPRANIPDF
jgi:hypothetical protein